MEGSKDIIEITRENQLKYHNIIKDNPKSIFNLITKEKLNAIKAELCEFSDPELKEESTILEVNHEIDNHKIIINDINRTRVKESVLIPNFKDILESL